MVAAEEGGGGSDRCGLGIGGGGGGVDDAVEAEWPTGRLPWGGDYWIRGEKGRMRDGGSGGGGRELISEWHPLCKPGVFSRRGLRVGPRHRSGKWCWGG